MQPIMSTAIAPSYRGSAGRLVYSTRQGRTARDELREDDNLAQLGVVVTVAAGEILFFEGDRAEHLFEVRSGMVRTCRLLADGRRHISGFLGAGELLGLNGGGTCSYTAEAVTATTLVRYPRGTVEAMAERSAPFAHRLLAAACRELDAAREQMLLLGRKRADERIASFLVSMARRQVGLGASGDLVHLPMSRTDIADFLGLTIETVSRTLSQFRREGLIELPSAQSVVLVDEDALADLAGLAADAA